MSNNNKMNAQKKLLQHINDISVIDTHAHIGSDGVSEDLSADQQAIEMLTGTYTAAYLRSSGADIASDEYQGKDLVELLAMLAKDFKNIVITGTGSVAMEGLKSFFGFNGDFADTHATQCLIEDIKAAYSKGLQVRCDELFKKFNIEFALKNTEVAYLTDYLPSLQDEDRKIEKRLFRSVPKMDSFLFGLFDLKGTEVLEVTMPFHRNILQNTMEQLNAYPKTFDDYLGLIDLAFDTYVSKGAVGVKLVSAFVRPLRFDDYSFKEAQQVFDKRKEVDIVGQVKPFQDYIFKYILDKCASCSLPIEIHTGHQAGSAANLHECSPALLTNLFQDKRFDNVKFALLHGGFPYLHETAVLVKAFHNAYLNFAWLPLISTELTARCLTEWLQIVPLNKLMYGADTVSVEGLCIVTQRLRMILSKILSNMVFGKDISEDDALMIAKKILRANGQDLYNLR